MIDADIDAPLRQAALDSLPGRAVLRLGAAARTAALGSRVARLSATCAARLSTLDPAERARACGLVALWTGLGLMAMTERLPPPLAPGLPRAWMATPTLLALIVVLWAAPLVRAWPASWCALALRAVRRMSASHSGAT